MLGLKIAAQTRAIPGSIKKALHTLAGLECDGVQFDARVELRPPELSDTGLRQLRKMLDDLNLRVASIAFPTHRGLGSPDDLERRLEAALAAMQLASRLQARILVCELGRLPEQLSTADGATLVEALTSLASHGDRLGVQIAGQATFASVQSATELADSLPERTVMFDLHPARLIAGGISPAEFVAAAGKSIAHVHAVDAVHDQAAGRGVEVELGRGTAEFPELLGLLEEHAYRGWLTIERSGSAQPIEDVGNGVKYLRSI